MRDVSVPYALSLDGTNMRTSAVSLPQNQRRFIMNSKIEEKIEKILGIENVSLIRILSKDKDRRKQNILLNKFCY